MDEKKIKELVGKLTLEEKAALTSGQDAWCTRAIERLGIPPARTSDGPHGLRVQLDGTSSVTDGTSLSAVCFPPACTTAASFDRELLRKMGEELGRECQAYGVNVLLGPGVNIKRSPLCGRNFEYFSEDPLLAGELGAALIQGVQSQGTGTSLKHFFANNQEHRRSDSSSEMDERTMREIYLTAFETVVKKAKPWTVMASYNKINGVYATENAALEDILRNEWGFEGLVMSDWGATHDRVKAVEAGCDLTMPSEDTDSKLVKAVQEGRLAEEALDVCCSRVLRLAFQAAEEKREAVTFDFEGGHRLASQIASESMVLLENDGLLPLDKTKSVAFIGLFAASPRYQGGGSSHINSRHVVSAMEAAGHSGLQAAYAPGYKPDGSTDDRLLEEAVQAAKTADTAVVFIGLTDAMETEGVDRRHMRLPEGHDRLMEAVCRANPNTVAVLHNGSPVELLWADQPRAILETYLGGEAVGEAVIGILFGEINPSGHLPESFPFHLEDNPSYLSYFGEAGKVPYAERLFVGYRYYESKKYPVRWAFGHGLSYTTFAYSDLTVDKSQLKEGEDVIVRLTVTNTGNREGKDVIQLYIAPEKVEMIRPVRELKEFAKIMLAPGESRNVVFHLDSRSFAHWNPTAHAWRSESGRYMIQIGYNAHDIALEVPVVIHARPIIPEGGYSLDTEMAELAKTAEGWHFLNDTIDYFMRSIIYAGVLPPEICEAMKNYPGKIDMAAIDRFAAMAEGASATSAGGSNAMLSQPISILYGVLPEEEKARLNALLAGMKNLAGK